MGTPLLADLFSSIDSAKRVGGDFLGGLLTDPAEALRVQYRNRENAAGENLDALGQLYKTPGGAVSFNPAQWSPQSAAAHQNLVDQATGGVMGATVWHGTPHVFDKFDSRKIGTGEGTQVYGHGLYLAEHPDVASTYQPRSPKLEAAFMARYKQAERANDYASMEVLENYLLNKRPDEIASSLSGFSGQDLARAKAAHEWAAKQYATKSAGGLYKVDLPDEHIGKMLDWDKPLSQQPAQLQELVRPHVGAQRAEFARPDPSWGNLGGPMALDEATLTGEWAYKKLVNDAAYQLGDRRGPLWEGIKNDPNRLAYRPADLATKQLTGMDIPGIRYLDQFSRGGGANLGTGTSNYVVFPGREDILRIIERNGLPLLGPGR